MWNDLFLDHPHAVGESYFQHQRRAFGFAAALLRASLACAVHAIAPGLFAATASETIRRLDREMSRRAAQAAPPADPRLTPAE